MPGFDLAGLSVLVTGAAGGIGRAVADEIRACGAAVVGWDLRLGDGIAAVDVTDRAAIDTALAELEESGRLPGGLVNCAGISRRGAFLDMGEADWSRTLAVNLTGTFNVTQLWARRLARARGPGSVVNMGSITAAAASPDGVAYAASKGGVDALTRGMAVALASHGIRVNALAPGPIATKMNRDRWSTQAGRARLMQRVQLGRLGEPQDLAGLVAFLLSPRSSWITGSTFVVDGGILASR